MPFMEVIFPPQRAGMGEEIQEGVDRKHGFDLLQVIKGVFIAILPSSLV